MHPDETDLIGKPLDDVPQQDPTDEYCMGRKKQKRAGEVVRDEDGNALFGGYCRATPGKMTDHLGEGRCTYHGGSSTGAPSGPENGNWKHGLFSGVVSEEDKSTLHKIEQMTTAAKLESTLNVQLMKLHRALASSESADTSDFWEAFAELVSKVEEPEETDLRSLAGMLTQNDRYLREWMDLIRRTAKDLHKITDGESVSVDVGVDEEGLEEVRALVEGAYGSDGEE